MTFRLCAASRAAALLLASTVLGCNLEEGLRKTPTVLSPDEVAAIEGPGKRLLAGNFHGLTTRWGRLVMRKVDGPKNTLVSVDPQHESSCELENAERFAYASTGWVAYSDAASNFTEIHFAAEDCTALPAVVSNASMPYDVTEDGEAVMVIGSALVAVDPVTEQRRVLADPYTSVQQLGSRDQKGYVWLVKQGDQFIEFDWNWKELSRVGEKVGGLAFVSSPPTLAFEDNGKLNRMSVDADGKLSISLIAEDGCRPRTASSTNFAYLSPCNEPTLHTVSGRGTDVDWGALGVQPEQAVALPKGTSGIQLLFLRDIDPNVGTGSLWLLDAPGGEPQKLAEHADLGWVQAAKDDSIYALVDIENDLGKVVHFAKDGSTEELVTEVPRNGNNQFYYGRQFWFFAHPQSDGTSELVRICALASCDGNAGAPAVQSIARGVPDWGFASALDSNHVAVLHDVSKGRGTLSTDSGALVAEGVPQGGFAALYPIMKQGIAYLTHYDSERAVGTLEYWNLELDARGTVAENVSEFMRADWPYMGIVYLVPSGDNAGLWYARGK
ncbi:MAG TPA: hypothetical protein VFQ35_26880 [Polyangiaceae bacterium]|nr:hypothetical protein [Polyangiaceae bacterium]